MDVDTSFHHDRKFKKLARFHPELVAEAIAAYMMLLADSWREGERVTLEESWALFPFNPLVESALQEVGLIDDSARVAPQAWESWFGEAFGRVQKARERYRKADAKRPSRTTSKSTPTLSHSDNQTGKPHVGPAMAQRGKGGLAEPEDARCPNCGLLVNEADGVVDLQTGLLWHKDCDAAAVAGGPP
jgi:hypothetical protein